MSKFLYVYILQSEIERERRIRLLRNQASQKSLVGNAALLQKPNADRRQLCFMNFSLLRVE
jgi:hypothetical protein